MKKEIKHCAYDLFLCCAAGVEIVLACSLAEFINVIDVDFQCCEAIGCAVGATIGGVVLLTHSVDDLVRHIKDLRQNRKE